ncbi:hypothetical protein BX600DRAFT_227893 [Xylariales sp. PMI_506]|nr:hypothetical protein BX600DRAFT_227893 [Xylariales sp. PMI_506]
MRCDARPMAKTQAQHFCVFFAWRPHTHTQRETHTYSHTHKINFFFSVGGIEKRPREARRACHWAIGCLPLQPIHWTGDRWQGKEEDRHQSKKQHQHQFIILRAKLGAPCPGRLSRYGGAMEPWIPPPSPPQRRDRLIMRRPEGAMGGGRAVVTRKLQNAKCKEHAPSPSHSIHRIRQGSPTESATDATSRREPARSPGCPQ